MDAEGLLEQLVRIESVSGQEEAAVAFLVEAMSRLGFHAYTDEAGNAVGELGDGPDTVVLLGHIDTVPGRVPVRREGPWLYGRGTVDAKGPLAAFVAAAAQVGPQPGRRLVVVGAVEEEAATSKGARRVRDRFADAPPSACIVGEPSGWDRVTLGYKGRLLVEVTLQQPAGHTAGPHGGVAEAGVLLWQALQAHAEAFNAGRERAFDRLLPSLRRFQTGSDGLTDQAHLTIGLRLPPGLERAALEAALEAAARRVEAATPARVHLTTHGYEPAFQAPRRNSLVRAFLAAIRAEGGRPRFVLKTGTSDMNVVGPVWGCPIVAYGAGDAALDHTPEERIHLGEFRRSIAVLSRVLQHPPAG